MSAIRVEGPGEILAVLPYQLGFHPRRSLVAVALRGGEIDLVARIDLPPPDQAAQAAHALIDPIAAHRPSALILVGYEPTLAASALCMGVATNLCRAFRMGVRRRLVVRDGQWFDIDCSDPRCCPSVGRPLLPPSEVAAVAELVGMGVHALPDRADLGVLVEPTRDALQDAVAREVADLLRPGASGVAGGAATQLRPITRRRAIGAWSRLLREPSRESANDLAVAATSLLDVRVRDDVIAWLTPGAFAGEAETQPPASWVELRSALEPLPPAVRTSTRRSDPPSDQPVSMVAGGHGACTAPGSVQGLRPDRAVAAGRATIVPTDPGEQDAVHRAAIDRVRRALAGVAAHAPPEVAPGALTVLAAFAWWCGDGALTQLALARARRIDPGYRLAVLLSRMADLGIRVGPGGVPPRSVSGSRSHPARSRR